MSLIVNSPITLPVVAKDVPTPISGTRGLVAKDDGWYDYQSDGTETKIPNSEDLSQKANKSDLDAKLDTAIGIRTSTENITVAADTENIGNLFNTVITPGDVQITFDSGGSHVSLRDIQNKVDKSELNAKVDKIEGKSLIDENFANAISYYVPSGGTENPILNLGGITLSINKVITGSVDAMGSISAQNGDITTILPSDGEPVIHKLSEKANSSDVLEKTNTTEFTPTADYQPATKKYVDDIVIEAGGGDMLRTVYDKDKTGTVDDSKKLGGQLPSYYSKATDVGVLTNLNTTNKTNIVSAVNEKWTGKVYTVEVGNDWEIHTVTSNGEEKLGSYYQEIAVEGITSVGQPFVDVVLPDDDVQAKQQLTDYQCVSRVRTENGKIILKCFEDRPSSSFTIRVLVLGNVL